MVEIIRLQEERKEIVSQINELRKTEPCSEKLTALENDLSLTEKKILIEYEDGKKRHELEKQKALDERNKIFAKFSDCYKKASVIYFRAASIDGNPTDHQWLTDNGYEIISHSDCTYAVKGLPGLHPTTYGNRGELYRRSATEETERVFIRMFDAGVIKIFDCE